MIAEWVLVAVISYAELPTRVRTTGPFGSQQECELWHHDHPDEDNPFPHYCEQLQRPVYQRHPTADDLFGCSRAASAATGECP